MGLWGVVKKAINSEFTTNPLNTIVRESVREKAFPLQSMFDWAGGQFPFAGATDVTISANTTWSDSLGFKKVKKLTIAAGVTITITKSPFFIFAEEIIGGGAGCVIDASGPSGAASGTFTCGQAKGGLSIDGSARAQGGCGGGTLVVVCNKYSGAQITLKANGGNGYRNTTASTANAAIGGQGAFSSTTIATASAENFSNFNLMYRYLGIGGGSNPGKGGGSGGGGDGTSASCSGGSGAGGGGGCSKQSKGSAGEQSTFPFTIIELIKFALSGCLGGGGGGSYVSANTSYQWNGAGGGGGGMIIAIDNDPASVMPAMQANGGTGATLTGDGSGAAGLTKYYNLAE